MEYANQARCFTRWVSGSRTPRLRLIAAAQEPISAASDPAAGSPPRRAAPSGRRPGTRGQLVVLRRGAREVPGALDVPHPRQEEEPERHDPAQDARADERRSGPEHAGHGAGDREGEGHEADRDEPVEARDPSQQALRDEAALRGRPDDRSRTLQRVEDEARDHRLPGEAGEPEAGDGEGRERPDPVHERDVAAGHVPVPHHHGGEHRPDAAEREDEPEVARRPVHVVLDDERQQDLGGTPEDQVRERRGEEGAPQPYTRADEAEPLLDVLERGLRLVRGPVDITRPHARDARDRQDEGERIDQEGRAGVPAPDPDQPSPDRGAEHPGRGRTDELVEGVRLVQIRARHQLRHDGIEGRAEERGPGPERGCHDHHVPELEGPADRQHTEGGHAQSADRVGCDHHPPPVEPVAHHTADQEEAGSAAASSRRPRSRARSGRSRARRPATRARRGRCRRRSATRSSRSRAAGSLDAGAAGGSARDPTARSCITPFARPLGAWIGGDRGPRSLPGSPRGRVVQPGIPPGRRAPSGRHRATARRRR